MTDEARYYRASREANRAWLATQPQLVIGGVLDEVDAGTDGPVGVGLIEPVSAHSPTSPEAGSTPTQTERN